MSCRSHWLFEVWWHRYGRVHFWFTRRSLCRLFFKNSIEPSRTDKMRISLNLRKTHMYFKIVVYWVHNTFSRYTIIVYVLGGTHIKGQYFT